MNEAPAKQNVEAAGATVRSFVAAPLSDAVKAELFSAAQSLAGVLPAVKWSRKVENLHVTIKFLGPVAEARIGELAGALDRAVGDLPPFEIALRGLGAFPSLQKAHVIWAGVEDRTGGLARISAAVETLSAELGIGNAEPRAFQPHVTLGRSKAGLDARAALAPFADRAFGVGAEVRIDELQLYESRLGGAGSTYILRSKAALGPNKERN
ncbi:MAG TPA: RNA 2',3'-cyclic phosphodiesterase [Polyangia bacterium]|nr:RNA 2',3'-cyclic phosphodiesterase [Polyangia bacterium]